MTPPFPILRSQRLVLRELRPGDIAAIHRLKSDPAIVSAYFSSPKTYEQSLAKLDALIAANRSGESMTWAIALAAGPDNLIGDICLWNFREARRVAEIGYELLPEFHRQGISGEAAARLVAYGFDELGLLAIDALVNPENTPSWRLLERLGFQKMETIEEEKEGLVRRFLRYELRR